MKTPVLIAERHELLRQGLRSLISALPDFEVIGDCGKADEAVRLALHLRPALILMDLSLPGCNGLEATAQIKRALPGVKVAVLSSYQTPESLREARRCGADCTVVKDASYEELVLALRRLASGQWLAPADAPTQRVGDELLGPGPAAKAARRDKVTERERSIWQLVAQGRTNRAAAAYLNVSPKTVEKHRASLMRKLGLRNAAQLRQAALQSGLIEHLGPASSVPGSQSAKAQTGNGLTPAAAV